MLKKNFCLDFSCEVKGFQKTNKGPRFIIEGFASTNMQDLVDDVIQLDALEAAARDLLSNNTVFLNHDRLQPIGTVIDAKFIPGKGLWIKVLISETRKDIQQLIKENILNKFSIGGTVQAQRKGRHPKTGKMVNFIIRIKLHEVSLVSLPANQDARGFSWSLEKSFSTDTKLNGKGGDYKVKIKVKANAQGLPIIVDDKYVPFDGQGHFAEVEADVQATAPDETQTTDDTLQPAIETSIQFSDEDLKAVEVEAETKAAAAVKVKQVEMLCDLLSKHPDEEVGKVGVKIKELTSQIDFGQGVATQGTGDGLKASDVESIVRKAVADVVVDGGLMPAVTTPAAKGTQKGLAPAKTTDLEGMTQDQKMELALADIKKRFPAGRARLKAMASLRSLGSEAPQMADPRKYTI